MNGRGNELGAITDLIAEKTRFMRPYLGEVLDVEDSESRGRVKCSVPELGWFTGGESPWCDPLHRYDARVPAAGEYVVVMFMAGNPSRPVYLGTSGEVAGQAPKHYSGPATRVLYSDGERQVTYDADADELLIDGFGSVKVNGDSKSLVTHAELDAALQAMVNQLNLHTHLVASLGAPTGPASASTPPVTFSVDISAAETRTLKTGG